MVLADDYSTSCGTGTHAAFQLLAGIVIIVVAFGTPICFCFTLVAKSRSLDEAKMQRHARVVASDVDINQGDAFDVIRELSLGGEFGFLLKAYSSEYCKIPTSLPSFRFFKEFSKRITGVFRLF